MNYARKRIAQFTTKTHCMRAAVCLKLCTAPNNFPEGLRQQKPDEQNT
jgi:hypothetical protein